MSESISADKLAAEIMRQMREYTEEAKKTTQKVAKSVSGKAVKKLKENSPKSENGGTMRKTGQGRPINMELRYTINLQHIV